MAESWKIRILRWRFNWYPAFRNTGARVTYISEDKLAAKLHLPLCRVTRNLHGTIYGGSMYAAIDALHAVLIATNLGPAYHVWMKAAQIEFRRPGRGDLFADARITSVELDEIRSALETETKIDRDFPLSLADASGEVAAQFRLTVHIRRRRTQDREMEGILYS